MSTVATRLEDWETLSHCLLCNSEHIRVADVEYNVSRCNTCGYVFDNPRPTQDAIIRYYSRPGKYDPWIAAETSRERLWKRRVKKLLKHARGGSLLDVGTGTGQFLSLAQPFFSRVAGTEVSQTALIIAKTKYNLDLLQGQIEDCDLPKGSFDTVTLFHVLEHVPDPKKTIERCNELLSEQGVLVICVPNDLLAWTSKIKLLSKRLGFHAFQKFSPTFGLPRVFTSNEIHLSHFTPSVLRRCVEQAGLEVIDESIDPYYAASGMRQILHSAYYMFHGVLFGMLRINRYDTIWMAARKVNSSMQTVASVSEVRKV